GVAGHHSDLWHNRVADGADQLGAAADNAALLGLFAYHETHDVLEEDQRNFCLVAVQDEAGGLISAVSVKDAADFDFAFSRAGGQTLVGNKPHRMAADFGKAADERFAKVCLVFLKSVAVGDAVDQLMHIVKLAAVSTDKVIEMRGLFFGFGSFLREFFLWR